MHRSMAFAKRASEVLPPSNSFHNVISQLASFKVAISQIRSTPRSSATFRPSQPRARRQLYLLHRIPFGFNRSLSFLHCRARHSAKSGQACLCRSPRHGAFPATGMCPVCAQEEKSREGLIHRSPTNSYLDERCSSASCADDRSPCERLIFSKTITPFLSRTNVDGYAVS